MWLTPTGTGREFRAAVVAANDGRHEGTPTSLTTIGFDADDTLWQNEHFYRLTEARFAELLGDHLDAPGLSARLLEAEKRNLKLYGFGIKSFTLSMIETAVEVTEGPVPGEVIGEILSIGREHAVTSDRDAAACPRDAGGARRFVPAGADHQGRPVRPGAQARAVGPRRIVRRGRDRQRQGRHHLQPASSRATATARSGA